MHNDGMQLCSSGHAFNLPEIEIRPLQTGEDATAFRTLNEEWITRYFTLEKMDRETLGDPEGKILRKGGHIFMAYIGRAGCWLRRLNSHRRRCLRIIEDGGFARDARAWDRPQATAARGYGGEAFRGEVLISGQQ